MLKNSQMSSKKRKSRGNETCFRFYQHKLINELFCLWRNDFERDGAAQTADVSLQVDPADGRDHGREGEQDHHLCRDQETLWWPHTQDEAWRVRAACCHGSVRLGCSQWFNHRSFFRWPAMCIHGDKSQPERDWVLSGKKSPLILSSLLRNRWMNLIGGCGCFRVP